MYNQLVCLAQAGLRREPQTQSDLIRAHFCDPNPMGRVPDFRKRQTTTRNI